VGQVLYDNLFDGEVVLSDRRPPEFHSHIDHLVVAPSGVWVVEVKNWAGRLAYESRGKRAAPRLYDDDDDRTYYTAKAYGYMMSVDQIVGDHAVPVHPVLAVIASECSFRTGLRFLRGKPIRHERVWICPPYLLPKLIKGPGPLDPTKVVEIARLLDEAMAPR
jgi:hypothetical protein